MRWKAKNTDDNHHNKTTATRAYAVFAFLPRTFLGGAGFFSFWAVMSAETRARAACVSEYVSKRVSCKKERQRSSKETNVSAKESGNRGARRTGPDSDMARVQGEFDRLRPDQAILHIMSTPNFHNVQRALGGAFEG